MRTTKAAAALGAITVAGVLGISTAASAHTATVSCARTGVLSVTNDHSTGMVVSWWEAPAQPFGTLTVGPHSSVEVPYPKSSYEKGYARGFRATWADGFTQPPTINGISTVQNVSDAVWMCRSDYTPGVQPPSTVGTSSSTAAPQPTTTVGLPFGTTTVETAPPVGGTSTSTAASSTSTVQPTSTPTTVLDVALTTSTSTTAEPAVLTDTGTRVTAQPSPVPELPRTGSRTAGTLAAVAFLLLLGGCGLVVIGRRDRA